MSQLSIAQLLEDLREDLGLELLAGKAGLGRAIRHTRYQKNGLPLAGFLEELHTDRVQIWGNTEIHYLNSMAPEALDRAVSRFFRLPVCTVLAMGGGYIPSRVVEVADQEHLPLLRSPLPGSEVLPRLQSYLENHLSPHARLHGVLVDLYGVGVLIQGRSGIGKSECALHLVTRGHRLVADDVVDIQLRGPDLVGRSTDLLKHHIEVRGLGILNLKDLFGVVAIRYEKNVELLVELVPWSPDTPFERLGIDLQMREILGRDLPLVRIPVAPGRNIPTLIEVAARNLLLQRMGFFSAEEFSRSLTAQIATESLRHPAGDREGGKGV
ncbi:MAG: HPr(Ser) kinase/phosphatase [Candidatus Tectomicrobia bacterium]|uniref:HPr kinase/phosphorylase n=1 Tax=Tectimicrobiota bacterium TaxID=2528274 RepID=A0A932MN81_UNCTE|nr:HPr(Ser) kinase/phosphatase [Candidatus Tectomicrobia bacterium]